MATVHWHTTDEVNGQRYVHPSLQELERYLAATGREAMQIAACRDSDCLKQSEDDC